jgi:hypothetical protein
MNPGDLKNTFIDKDGIERTVVIPAEVFRAARREKISNKVAIDRYLAEQGYLDQTAVEETATAKARKPRTRKPNDTKRGIINVLADSVKEAYVEADAVEITNPERQFRFVIDGKTYEVTLVQKRK